MGIFSKLFGSKKSTETPDPKISNLVDTSSVIEDITSKKAFEEAFKESAEVGGDETSSWFRRLYERKRRDAYRELKNRGYDGGKN